MSEKLLDQFGILLMQQVRDDVISLLDKTIDGKMVGQAEDPFYQHIQKLASSEKEALQLIAPLAVDLTLQFFLAFIEKEKSLDLFMKSEEGLISLKHASIGLSDELHSLEGWIARFSSQRNYEQKIFGE